MSTVPFQLPIKSNGNERWVQCSLLATTHIILGEVFREKNGNYSHFGGHRVRAYTVKGNVHWLLPEAAMQIDISRVAASQAPRRKQRR